MEKSREGLEASLDEEANVEIKDERTIEVHLHFKTIAIRGSIRDTFMKRFTPELRASYKRLGHKLSATDGATAGSREAIRIIKHDPNYGQSNKGPKRSHGQQEQRRQKPRYEAKNQNNKRQRPIRPQYDEMMGRRSPQ